MALELNFTVSDTTNAAYISIIDSTGDYNASTNPTGWGVPNATKASVTVSSVDITLPNETTPITVDLFVSPYVFPQTADRWSYTPAAEATTTPTAVTGATDASPIVLAATAHGLSDGDMVVVSGTLGNLSANGFWQVEAPTANTLTLLGSDGSGTYASGGFVQDNDTDTSELPSGVYKFEFTVTAGGTDYTDEVYHLHLTALQASVARYGYLIQQCGCNPQMKNRYTQMQSLLDRAQAAFDAESYQIAQELVDSLERICDRIDANCTSC